MKFIFSAFFFLITITGFTQENINYFSGNFDSALDEAKKTNKNIFFITRSESCHVFDVFKENITQDSETIEFLNKEFIVFEFDMDKVSENESKRLKKYYHSWRGFPQLYFIDKNEKLISDIIYSLEYSHNENLNVWENYKQIENEWKIIKRNKRTNLNLDNLKTFLLYRQIKYSPYDLMQIQNVIGKYFKKIDEQNYSNKENWILFEKYITIHSNPELFDFVAKNKSFFQKEIDTEKVSKYLSRNYYKFVSWKSEEDRKKLTFEYPFNSIKEAKIALKDFNKIGKIEPTFNFKE